MMFRASQLIYSIILSGSIFSPILAKPYNIVMITVDDLNDWIGPYQGGPLNPDGTTQTLTPHINQFCDEGSVVFRNAVCSAPVCGPSRSSLLSGYLPSTTGIYGNASNMRASAIVANNPTLPEYFRLNGYQTTSIGKFFHSHGTTSGAGRDFGEWAVDRRIDTILTDPPNLSQQTSSRTNRFNGVSDNDSATRNHAPITGAARLEWGPTSNPDPNATNDFIRAQWIEDQFSSPSSNDLQEPFFIGLGIYKPHIPWYNPPEFIDQYNETYDSFPGANDLANLQLPVVLETDLDDIVREDNGRPLFRLEGDSTYNWVVANDAEHNTIREATRAYMASVSHADAALGKIFEAIENSVYANNTIIIVMGDHGWHLGEKLHYHKNTVWEESARTPLFIRIPGMEPTLRYCDNPVSLVDVYPTLLELCDLPVKHDLDGVSRVNMIENPDEEIDSVGVMVTNRGASALTKNWYYVEDRAQDNVGPVISRQLYDRSTDPLGNNNLFSGVLTAQQMTVVNQLQSVLPQTFAPAINRAESTAANSVPLESIKVNRLLSQDSDNDGVNNFVEQFLGTNGTLGVSDDPNRDRYPKVMQKASGQISFRYGVSNLPNGINYDHQIVHGTQLSSLDELSRARPSVGNPEIYEFEVEPREPNRFFRLRLDAVE